MFQEDEVREYISSPSLLANEVLRRTFNGRVPSFPIDPFMILDKLNVVYQFRDFKELEGIYIVPDDEDDIPIIGINNIELGLFKDIEIHKNVFIDRYMKNIPVERLVDKYRLSRSSIYKIANKAKVLFELKR